MKILAKLGLVAALAAASANLSCNVNDYCLNCATGDGGTGDGAGDGGHDGDPGDGDPGDGGCTNTGPEVCDGDDNDCDGAVDEGVLPTIGDLCDNQMGECSGGVKQCTNGVVVCSKPPVPEICDLKDNDCNGLTDEGDPGGGAVCGTNTGECVAGTNRCISGQIQCVGAVGPGVEACNNRDDDCDGNFDENLVLGNCVAGVDGPQQGNTGACELGVRQCLGGVTSCVGAVFPTFELCDTTNIDQDCDGNPSNGYNFAADPQNCGGCGMVCNLPNAFEGCEPAPAPANGRCTIVACEPNYFNNNGVVADGCEFNCGHPYLGNEVCNGIDDDCDGQIDEATDLVAPVGLCNTEGACSTGTVLSCDAALGWRCHYNNPNVKTSDAANTQIIPETYCDSDIVAGIQADNDCDGRIDEGQANLGQPCDNGQFGDCRNSGANVCNATNRNGAAVCNFTTMGTGMAPESCDGRDNDCDNRTDEGANTGNLPGQKWVTIPGITPTTQIMQYEASRPDATATAGGTQQAYSCSRENVQPWTNITHPEAEAACASVNARLCTESEWQAMCSVRSTYPAAGISGPATAATNDFTFIEAEDPFANVTVGGRSWARVAPTSLNGVTAMQVPDTGFRETAAGSALANSPRLEYRLNLAASTNYRVRVRMRSPAIESVAGTPTRPTATLAPVSAASTEVGDLVVVTTWSRIGAGPPVHTLQGGFTQIGTQQLDEGNSDARLSVAYRVATVAGAQPYQAYASNGTSFFSGIFVVKAGKYNLAQLQVQSTSNTGSGPPDPPSSGTVGQDSIVLAIGGWRLDDVYNITTGPPLNFSPIWEVDGAQPADVALAASFVANGAALNPGAFTDNTGNVTGTASMTIAIGLPTFPSNSVWVGLTAGTTAGAANATALTTTGIGRWEWVQSAQLTTTTAGTYTLSVFAREDGALVDTIAIARHTTAPTFDNIWAYQNNQRSPTGGTCNGDEYDTNAAVAGDQDDILRTGALATCFANQEGTADAYDMSGNVKEWTAARAAGQNPLRGGASNNLVNGLTCQLNFTLADDEFFFPNVGFRCCR